MDGRSDLFSLGSMLCELLSGRRPFDAESAVATLFRIAHEEPVLELPASPEYKAFIPVLERALAKNPDERYATSAEFADALSKCLDDPALAARRKTALREGDRDEAARAPGKVKTTRPLAQAPLIARSGAQTRPEASARRPDPGRLFRILRDVYVGGKSGHLHFTSGPRHRTLRILKGQITHAISDTDGEHLGEVLVRYGVISQADLERALETERRLGPVLSGMGLLDKEGLEEALGLHVREILFTMLEEGDGSYVFEELTESALESDVVCRLSTGEVILEATRRVQNPEMVRQVLGDMGRVLVLSSDPLLRSQRLKLTPTDGFVLSRIDGTLSARDVISLSPVPAEDTERSLFGLLCTGTIDYEKPEQTSRTRPNVPARGLRREEGTARAGPTTAPRPPPSIAPSPPAATGPTSKPEPPEAPSPAPQAARPDPADAIRQAEGLLAGHRYEDAVRLVEPLVSKVDGPLKTRAAILLARGYMKTEKRETQAEGVLLDLIREDPGCTPAYLFLGALYRSWNQPDRARSMYQKVLQLEPRHRAAAAELSALGDGLPE